MGEVYDSYIDTAGNYHYTDTDTGHHVIRRQDEVNFFSDNACVGGLAKPESAKTILENMDAILKELENELTRIESAIYSEKPIEGTNTPKDKSMLETLNRQRDMAEGLLKLAVHIREGLW